MRRPALPLIIILAAACSRVPSPDAAPAITPESVTGVRIAPTEQPVALGDCAEALRRAAAKPDLAVDRIPSPIATKPAPLRNVPKSALRKDGSSEVKIDVLIDTLGKPDMKTFTVVVSSHPWLANNVKTVLAKWTFSPAELAGCKVPRVFHFMASSPARGRPGR